MSANSEIVNIKSVNTKKSTRETLFNILIGPALYLIIILILPQSEFSYAARGSIGTIVWMAAWWITRPVDIGVTALLPIIVNALFNYIPMDKILVNYASEIIILLLGADIITISWSASGLDRRIALKALCLIGTSVKQQTAVWFIISFLLSTLLPNVVVCAILTPVAVSMLKFIGEGNVSKSEISIAILLAIGWGSGVGGFGTPLGGAMNMVAISYIEKLLGREYMYTTWVIQMIPMLIVIPALITAYLLSMKTEATQLKGSKEFFKNEYKKMSGMSVAEKWGFWFFFISMLLAFVRPLYANLLPGLKPAYVFLLFGFLVFLVPNGAGGRLLTWKQASDNIMWGLFYLFAGGMAVGQMIIISGAAEIIAKALTSMSLSGGIGTVAVFVILATGLCNISSNTASAAIAIPIVISVCQKLGLDPMPYIYITAVAYSCAFVLPTSTLAIPVGYGLDPKVLIKRGFVLMLLSIITVTVMGYILLKFWPGFGAA